MVLCSGVGLLRPGASQRTSSCSTARLTSSEQHTQPAEFWLLPGCAFYQNCFPRKRKTSALVRQRDLFHPVPGGFPAQGFPWREAVSRLPRCLSQALGPSSVRTRRAEVCKAFARRLKRRRSCARVQGGGRHIQPYVADAGTERVNVGGVRSRGCCCFGVTISVSGLPPKCCSFTYAP